MEFNALFLMENLIYFWLQLQHLRLEDNPILDMPHAEAASILIVGMTLKRFNNRGKYFVFHIVFFLIPTSFGDSTIKVNHGKCVPSF